MSQPKEQMSQPKQQGHGGDASSGAGKEIIARDPTWRIGGRPRRRPQRDLAPYLLVMPLVIFTAVVFIYPIFHMAVSTLIAVDPITGAFGLKFEPFARIFADDFAREMVFRTIRTSVATTLLALVLAYPVTLGMRQLSARRRGLLVIVLLSPLLMSIVVRSLGWVVMLGPGGFINDFLKKLGLAPIRFLYTETAIVFGLAQVLLGFMVLSLLTSVLKIPENVIAAGSNLGARWWQVLWHIILPMTRPGIVAGTAIVFPLSASAYVTPLLLGGSKNPTMATEVYAQAIVQLQFSRASAMSLVLFLIICVGVALLGLVTLKRKRGES